MVALFCPTSAAPLALLMIFLLFPGCNLKETGRGGDSGARAPGPVSPSSSTSLWLPPLLANQHYREAQADGGSMAAKSLSLSHLRSTLLVVESGDNGRRSDVDYAEAEHLLRTGRPVAAAHLSDWLALQGLPLRLRGQRHGPSGDRMRVLLAYANGALAVFRPGPPGLGELAGCAMLRVAAVVQCPPTVPFDGATQLPDSLPHLLTGDGAVAGDTMSLSAAALRRPGSLQWLIRDDDFARKKQQHEAAAGSSPHFGELGSEAWRAAWKLAWFLVGTYDCGLKHVLLDRRGVSWAVDVGKILNSKSQWIYGQFPWFQLCNASSAPPVPPAASRSASSMHLLTTHTALSLAHIKQYFEEAHQEEFLAALGGRDAAAPVSFAAAAQSLDPGFKPPAADTRAGWALAPLNQAPSAHTVAFGVRNKLVARQLTAADGNSSFFRPWRDDAACHAAVSNLESRVLLGHLCSKEFVLVNWHGELWSRPKCESRRMPICWRPTPSRHQLSRHVFTDFVPLLANWTRARAAFQLLAEAGVDEERAAAFFDRLRQAAEHAVPSNF